MELLKPLKTRQRPSQKVFAHKDLHTYTRVFARYRVDRVRKRLEQTYDGSLSVVKRHKYFIVTIKDTDYRLKPPYLLSEMNTPHHSSDEHSSVR